MIKFTRLNLNLKVLILFLFVASTFKMHSQAIGVTVPAATGSYCAGTNVNVTFTISGTFSNTPTPNVFSAQISDNIGSFAGSPVTIGTRTNITAGTILCTLPSTLLTSGLYRIRVISSNPSLNGSDNGADLTVVAITINAPTLTQTSFCQSETITVNFTQSSCAFVNTPAANVYSVELSNASGSFASPVVIGTRTNTTAGAITCVIPPGTSPGTGYRIRISTSSPTLTSADNGSNLSVVAVAGTPSIFGNGKWNVYCYNTRNDFTTNYYGNYGENSLSFNTTTRWATGASPSSANSTGGTAYVGCAIPIGSASFVYKRTNIPCGYYQIDIPAHRHEVSIIINGTAVFSHTNSSGDAHTAAYVGMIVPTDDVELRCATISSSGNLQATFTRLNQLTMSAPVTVCAGTQATLTTFNSGTLGVNYSWTPTVSVSPLTGSTVIGTPLTSTTYTVIGTEPVSGCATFSNTVLVTVNPVPTTATSISSATICSGYSSTNITATGANTYTWSPSAGLNTTSGNFVVASPTVTTIYTVTGSNNCTTVNATRAVSVRTVPAVPSPTAFGSNLWNVFCYNGLAFNDLYGVYTETVLGFNTATRWSNSTNPSNANATGGAAYQGCILANTGFSFVYKRQGFPCGYYSINITHDDATTILVNGSTVFTHSGNDSHTATWTGFLGGVSTVEFRHSNSSGNGTFLQPAFVIVPIPILSPPVTICAGSTATLTAVNVSGLNYSWTPGADLNVTTGTIVLSTAPISTNYTCTVTDPATGCFSSATTSVTINPLPTTSLSTNAATVNCTSQNYTLTVNGANTYTWSPSAGLSATTGNSVIASPTVSTIYTVTGDNNCAALSATASIYVLPLINPTVVPTGTWNAYCYNTTALALANYYGYYTELGSGPSGYDFNTTTRWASGASPSTANTSSGDAYKGCTMPATNWNMSFKRTGFTCNTYTIFAINNDETLTILVNGTQVASRASSSASAALWVGVLSPSTTVELRLVQTTGTSGMSIRFTPETSAPSQAVWSGYDDNNWFNTDNWCGSALPTLSDDVIIYNTGAMFQPVINGAGAVCADLTIIGAKAAVSGSTSAIPAGILTISGTSGLEVYGDWNGYGTFTPASGTVSMLGTGTKSINCTTTETFYNLVLNNSGHVIMSPGTHRISRNLDFVSGIVDQNGVLQFLTGSTATNANDLSFVDGAVVKFGNQPFTFPVGTANIYRPIGISAPALVTDNFTAQYFNADASPPYTYSLTDASIHHISRCEHWILNRSGGSAIVRVTMSWDVNSCGVDNLSDLAVARWDAGQVKWKDHGNGGTTGNTTSGTIISSAAVTVFSPFTLASKTQNNILPIELIDFTTRCLGEGVELNWSTALERNNSHFIIESSNDGQSWTEIKKVYSGANSSTLKNYTHLDQSVNSETVYYRLAQVDKDGARKDFKVVSSHCNPLLNDFKFYPNPATSEISLLFNVSENHPDGQLTITDNLGRTCFTKGMELKKGNNKFLLPLKLSSGIYYISFSSYTFKAEVQKLVID